MASSRRLLPLEADLYRQVRYRYALVVGSGFPERCMLLRRIVAMNQGSGSHCTIDNIVAGFVPPAAFMIDLTFVSNNAINNSACLGRLSENGADIAAAK
jgi:hypothetical protein